MCQDWCDSVHQNSCVSRLKSHRPANKLERESERVAQPASSVSLELCFALGAEGGRVWVDTTSLGHGCILDR